MTDQVWASGPAKVNLCLGVGARRSDGFHRLATVYQALGLRDWLGARPAPVPSIRVGGTIDHRDSVPVDGSNLVLRALAAVERLCGRALPTAFELDKAIPVAGGLAGGSSNAAAALVAINDLYDLGLGQPQLLTLAAELGSDVPFCLVGGTVAGSGRGETVEALHVTGEYWWVLVPNSGGLSTAAVYAEFDAIAEAGATSQPVAATPRLPVALLRALEHGDLDSLGRELSNDLARAAYTFRPDLAGLVDAGLAAGALGGLVSGSGPTTAFLASSATEAERLAGFLAPLTTLNQAFAVPGSVPGAVVETGPRARTS